MRGVLPVVLAAILLPGCGSGRKLSAENDRIRARVLDLETDVERLADRNAELEAALHEATEAPESLPEELRANIPYVADIEIDRLSHVIDEDEDGRAEGLLIYVTPADGLGRFVQLAGSLSVHAALLPPDADPVSLGRMTLGPADVRRAYRSSFTGTHYRLVLPLTLPGDREAIECSVRVVYEDGRTGRRHTAERAIELSP
ncbi:MAG: hypothetical protein ACYSU7_18625 [Planctomycetota bacterium]|jgi:outer membrane murein-binding lipoprotein Lpp